MVLERLTSFGKFIVELSGNCVIVLSGLCILIRFDAFRMDDGSLRMYYTGQGTDGSTAVGVAKLAFGAAEWEREQAAFTFA